MRNRFLSLQSNFFFFGKDKRGPMFGVISNAVADFSLVPEFVFSYLFFFFVYFNISKIFIFALLLSVKRFYPQAKSKQLYSLRPSVLFTYIHIVLKFCF